MLEGLFASNNYQAAQRLLDVAVLRHEALASNIANAETPGYRRLDVNRAFTDELREAIARRDHESAARKAPSIEVDPTAATVRKDGSNVSIDHEQVLLNRNAMEFQFLTQYIQGSYGSLKKAISGGQGR